MVFRNRVPEIVQCRTKDFYDILVQKCFMEPCVKKYWLEAFNLISIPFESLLEQVHNFWKPPDCVELDYKIFHNRIFTNERLHQIGLIDSDMCMNCGKDKEDFISYVDIL